MIASPGPVAELREVDFAYRTAEGRRDVLRGASFAIRPGELAALLGANGSGKTTLLRVMTGTLRPDAGEVILFGRSAAEWSRGEVARRVAVLPQSPELPASFRVAELVALGRAPHATRLFASTVADEMAVERALLDADAEELAERPVEELSGGERQRVLVALALAQEPALLLLDEPTLHLDLEHQVALLATLRRLARQRGLAMLAVLHDLNLATRFVPRVAILNGGRIVADGPPRRVLAPGLVRDVFRVAVDAIPDGRGGSVLALRG